MLGATGFVLCGRYEATTSWWNCEFPYGKAPCLKGHQKKKIKIQNHVEEKGNVNLEQIWLQGSSWAEPQSCMGWVFHPRSLRLAASCLPPPVLSKCLCLFAIIRTPFCMRYFGGCCVLFQHCVAVFCSGLRSILMQMWSQKFWHIVNADWINKKEMWNKRASSHNKIHFPSLSNNWAFSLGVWVTKHIRMATSWQRTFSQQVAEGGC